MKVSVKIKDKLDLYFVSNEYLFFSITYRKEKHDKKTSSDNTALISEFIKKKI